MVGIRNSNGAIDWEHTYGMKRLMLMSLYHFQSCIIAEEHLLRILAKELNQRSDSKSYSAAKYISLIDELIEIGLASSKDNQQKAICIHPGTMANIRLHTNRKEATRLNSFRKAFIRYIHAQIKRMDQLLQADDQSTGISLIHLEEPNLIYTYFTLHELEYPTLRQIKKVLLTYYQSSGQTTKMKWLK